MASARAWAHSSEMTSSLRSKICTASSPGSGHGQQSVVVVEAMLHPKAVAIVLGTFQLVYVCRRAALRDNRLVSDFQT